MLTENQVETQVEYQWKKNGVTQKTNNQKNTEILQSQTPPH